MALLEVVLVGVLVAGWIYSLVDIATTPAPLARNLPKMIWFLAVLLLPMLFGPLLWFLLGRPRGEDRQAARLQRQSAWRAARAQHPSSRGPRRPVRSARSQPLAPDDDPEFLEALARRLREGGPNPPP